MFVCMIFQPVFASSKQKHLDYRKVSVHFRSSEEAQLRNVENNLFFSKLTRESGHKSIERVQKREAKPCNEADKMSN